MAHTNLCTLRRRAFEQQRGFCHYCGLPMWEADETAFAARFGLSARLTRLLRSTAEHLVARCDGGRNERSNIVAACLWCNQRRHHGRCETAPSAEVYLQRVAHRMGAGRWHPTHSKMEQGAACSRYALVMADEAHEREATRVHAPQKNKGPKLALQAPSR